MIAAPPGADSPCLSHRRAQPPSWRETSKTGEKARTGAAYPVLFTYGSRNQTLTPVNILPMIEKARNVV